MKTCKDFYNDTAEHWADKFYGDDAIVPYLRSYLGLFDHSPKVLDLGCGSGYDSRILKNLGAYVMGIDFSENSIAVAKEKNPDIPFYVRDALLPYSDLGKFDGIVCIAVIMHFTAGQLKTAFKNMAAVIKHNGYLLLCFREGVGEQETTIYDGVEYGRNFIRHTRESILNAMNGLFTFDHELEPKANDPFTYLIYKKS